MARALSCMECAEAYAGLTGRNAADDGRFPFLEGVYWWRFERYQRDAVARLRRTLKTAPPLRDHGDDQEWRERFNYAASAFAAHAQLHSNYQRPLDVIEAFEAGQIAFSDSAEAELLRMCEEGMRQVPRAKKMPMHWFVLGAKARWTVKGWGGPTPAQLSLLAGSVGFDTISDRATARERWKSRIQLSRRTYPRPEALLLANVDMTLDGSGCFVIGPADGKLVETSRTPA